MVTLCFCPQQSFIDWETSCVRQYLRMGGYWEKHVATTFTRQRNLHMTVKKLLSQTPSSNNWKQKHYYYVCRHRKLLQSIEFWHVHSTAYEIYWAWLLCIVFMCFSFVGYFSLFLKSTACNCGRLFSFIDMAIQVHAMEADSMKLLSKPVIFRCG